MGFSSLGSVATAGIPIDDRLVSKGGLFERVRLQYETEYSETSFLIASVDYSEINNDYFNFRPFVVNELESLAKLRQRDFTSLAGGDLLEFVITPEFNSAEITKTEIGLNHLLANNWGLYGRFIYYDAENTSTAFKGNKVPFLPTRILALGASWVNNSGWHISTRFVYRSERFSDEPNQIRLQEGWDGAIDVYKESADKDWLIRLSIDDIFNKNLDEQVTAEINYRF